MINISLSIPNDLEKKFLKKNKVPLYDKNNIEEILIRDLEYLYTFIYKIRWLIYG